MSLSTWQAKINASNKAFTAWENRFKCRRIEEYMEGFQWREKTDQASINYKPYTLNLFLITRQIKLANWIFQRPSFRLTPSEQNSNEDFNSAILSSEMKQDVLNAVVHNPAMNFPKILKLAAQDSFSYFGMIEVGYAKDWRNPNKVKDLTKGDEVTDETEAISDTETFKIVKRNNLPKDEYAYIKRIKPERFRTSISDAEFLNDFPWVGYYEYYSVADLKNAKNITWPKDAEFAARYNPAEIQSGVITSNLNSYLGQEMMRQEQGLCKTWHIWDKVSGKRLLLLDAYMDKPLYEESFTSLPLADLRWLQRSTGFLPIPLGFNWISEQDEVNEAREQQRSYRRRYTRKFQALDQQVDPDELEKFASGPDGIVIIVKAKDAITPIENPEFGPTTTNELIIAKEDFNLVSGTSVDARGQSMDRETATAAQLLDKRAQIRESSEQLDFTDFVCCVGRLLLTVISENMDQAMWIKYTRNPAEMQPLSEIQVNAPIYRQIKQEQLDDGYDFEIELDVINATPAAMQQAKTSFVEFLTIVKQFPEVAMSAQLIRHAAYACGFRDETIIHQYQQVAVLALAAKASVAANAQGMTLSQAQNNASTAQIQQMTPPTQPALQSQMDEQVNNPVQ